MSEVVYYLRRDGLIKIGWTRNLASRMRRLRPDELLAVEPGNLPLETGRHRQFAAYRVKHPDGREWYSPAPDLLDHIARMASIYDALVAPPRYPSRPSRQQRPFTLRALPDLEPVSQHELDACQRVRELESVDLSTLSDTELLQALVACETAMAASPRWAGRFVNRLRRSGMTWAEMVERTGTPRTTLHNRLHARPAAGESA